MKTNKIAVALMVIVALILSVSIAGAGDFGWTRDLNIKAEADRDGFRAQLSARFNIGKAQVKVVFGKVDNPADAYLVFRLGEMSSKPLDYVLDTYKARKNQGWGAMAKSLGIKPGSREFKALKEGHDIHVKTAKVKGKKKKKK